MKSETPTHMDQEILLEELLLKKTVKSLVTSWQERYCVLKRNGQMEMYQSKQHYNDERMPRKVLQLGQYSKCINSEYIEPTASKFPFSVVPLDKVEPNGKETREFHFIANNRDSRRKWKAIMAKEIKLYNRTKDDRRRTLVKGFSAI
eukprot:CFRG1815T1